MKYKSVLDLHTHTVASGHAYCTIHEMAAAAAGKGLEILGITEHAPAMPGTCHNFYFHNLKVVPREPCTASGCFWVLSLIFLIQTDR